jgi:hypothetical protein
MVQMLSEGGGGLRSPLEAAQCRQVSDHVFGKELQRDVTVPPEILGFIDNAHTSALHAP